MLEYGELVEIVGAAEFHSIVIAERSAWAQVYAGPRTDVCSRTDFERLKRSELIVRATTDAHWGQRWVKA